MVQTTQLDNWRRDNKELYVYVMGKKCQCCGYDRCTDALTLHHIDPSLKSFSLSKIRISTKNFLAIIEELKKCILLCSVCHSEYHCGITQLPDLYSTFSQESLEKYIEENKCFCKICGKLVPHTKRNNKSKYTCSNICTKKLIKKELLENKNLLDEVKVNSITQLSEKYEVSEKLIKDTLKQQKLNIEQTCFDFIK